MPDNYTPRVKAISPINGRRSMVDNDIKSRHWANHTLKQAGLEKAF
ncbi:MAG: hypothetical protein ACHQRJ_17325 [Alphaproteobacteria bacterium]